jgi:hypothetical protein
MNRNFFSIVIMLMVLLLGLACSPQPTPATEASATPNAAVQGGEVEDQTSLIDALRAGGATVELGATVEQAFFTAAGQILKVNSKDVQVFEYETAEKMEADAAQIAPDGGAIGTSMVTWVEPPHFFKSGRVLVLYVGEDKAVIDLLKGALGEQFAGR